MQEKLGEMANSIGMFGLWAAVATFAVLAAKELYFIFYEGSHPFHIKPFLDFVIVAVTIVVVAIPEGLPLAVTISLAYSMQKMQEDNCLVRVLSACETMGGATTICSDKTGTLTTNRMSVVRGYIAGQHFDLTPTGNPNYDFAALPKLVVDTLCEAVSLNSTAEQKINEDVEKVWDGNKTEQGLLRFVAGRLDFDYTEARKAFDKQHKKQWPFNSAKKRMTTMVIKGTGVRGRRVRVLEPNHALPLTDVLIELERMRKWGREGPGMQNREGSGGKGKGKEGWARPAEPALRNPQ